MRDAAAATLFTSTGMSTCGSALYGTAVSVLRAEKLLLLLGVSLGDRGGVTAYNAEGFALSACLAAKPLLSPLSRL
jgi:hypothetical protein